jgi:hypothetical protein
MMMMMMMMMMAMVGGGGDNAYICVRAHIRSRVYMLRQCWVVAGGHAAARAAACPQRQRGGV